MGIAGQAAAISATTRGRESWFAESMKQRLERSRRMRGQGNPGGCQTIAQCFPEAASVCGFWEALCKFMKNKQANNSPFLLRLVYFLLLSIQQSHQALPYTQYTVQAGTAADRPR